VLRSSKLQTKNTERGDKLPRPLQTHHIDASVFLEPVLEGHDSISCIRYLIRASKTYQGLTSTLSLGEIQRNVVGLGFNKLITLYGYLHEQLNTFKINIVQPSFDCYSKAIELGTIEGRLKAPDALNIAVGVINGANCFTTLDRELIESSPTMEKRFGLKIVHPGDMI